MPTSTSKFKYIACDYDKCIGCQLCEYICSYTHIGEFNTYRSRIRVVRAEEIMVTAVACRTCEDAPCVVACTRDAMSQDPLTGIIRLDASKCDGCAWCIEACDFGAISINPETKQAEICDQCENVEGGAQCVLWCPKDALELVTSDQRAQKARKRLILETNIGPKV